MTYDENMEEFYLWTAADDICRLELDQSYQMFRVEDCAQCSCPYVSEYGWTESQLTMDVGYEASEEEAGPYQMVGPLGNLWTFHDLDKFSSDYPEWFNEFYALVYSEDDYSSYDDYDYSDYDYGDDEPVMCTMQYIDCSDRGGYDLSDPCMHTCNDDS